MRNVERELEMVELFKSGMTMQAIGDKFCMSRERVRQLISRHGISRNDGGNYVSTDYQKIYGCSREEVEFFVKNYPKCMLRFRTQRSTAKGQRGIEWKLTFKEWMEIWKDHWPNRGRGHKLVMCRFKDQGAYEVGNVFIAPGSFNNAAYAIRKWHGVDIDFDAYYASMG